MEQEIHRIAQEQIETIAEKCARIRPLVALSCITYNHEAYLRDALEGFVMQKTDFPFVAIVHDDASTDGSADIIREYAARYPDIILPIYETENQYSKGDGSVGRIMNAARNATGAKYIAECEGDDYWTSPLKLQKQIDFLESHPDYSMCFHNATEHFENNEISDRPFAKIDTREYNGIEIYENWIVPTASVIVRKGVFESSIYLSAKKNKRFIFGDIVLFLSAASLGKVYGMEGVMSVYRRHAEGATHNFSIERDLKLIDMQHAIVETFGQKYKNAAKRHISKVYMSIMQKQKKHGHKFKAALSLLKSMKYSIRPARNLITHGVFKIAHLNQK